MEGSLVAVTREPTPLSSQSLASCVALQPPNWLLAALLWSATAVLAQLARSRKFLYSGLLSFFCSHQKLENFHETIFFQNITVRF